MASSPIIEPNPGKISNYGLEHHHQSLIVIDYGRRFMGSTRKRKHQVKILKSVAKNVMSNYSEATYVNLHLSGNFARVTSVDANKQQTLYEIDLRNLSVLKWSQREKRFLYFSVSLHESSSNYECFFFQFMDPVEAELCFLKLSVNWKLEKN